uniref:Nucleotide-diphospho-sugar transferase domain-containing protein n=1 Tax=viral metagenome TaxID=1070528 RepID=A0A6C0EG43_9ZZZZ
MNSSDNVIEFYLLIYKNIFCAKYQIKTIRQFCKDPFRIIMLDSNCGEFIDKSEELKNLCESENIELMIIPNNYSMPNTWSSLILGNKLNYIYNNIIKIREPKYFAFLDQDMFMFRPFSIIPFLDKYGMWGDIDEPGTHKSPTIYKKDIKPGPWYLHPWLSFYKYDFVKNHNLDFNPCANCDTGGANWESFISKCSNLNKEDYWFRDNIDMTFPFKEISNIGPYPYQDHYFLYNNSSCYGQIQINNGFIHMLNSHSDILHPKVSYIKGFLDCAIFNDLLDEQKNNKD